MTDPKGIQNVPAPQQNQDPLILRVTYEGKSVANHEIEVRAIATSLLGLTIAIQGASDCISGEKPNISFKLKAIEGNCVSADIILSYTGQVISLLQEQSTTNLLSSLVALGLITGGTVKAGKATYGMVQKLILLYKNRKGKKSKETKTLLQNLTEEVLHLLADETTRTGISQTYSTLEEDGISSITTQIKGVKSSGVKITYKEKPALLYAGKGEFNGSEERSVIALITSLNFESENGWKIFDTREKKTIPVKMQDQDFKQKMNRGEIDFRRGDLYCILLRCDELITDSEVTRKYTIIKIEPLNQNQADLFSKSEIGKH